MMATNPRLRDCVRLIEKEVKDKDRDSLTC